jgi:choice-of-anchor B domain-containing protein
VNKLTVVDVTDKAAIQRTSVITWEGIGYVHQGWLTEDHAYLLLDDESDEQFHGHNGRTYIFDMRDLQAPVLIGAYTSREPAVDHNQYIRGAYVFQANYTAGLRILDISEIASARLREVAYFDTYPGSNAPEFTGAWSPYPFFPSGVVAVSTIDRGLFLLKPQIPPDAGEDHYLFLPLAINPE